MIWEIIGMICRRVISDDTVDFIFYRYDFQRVKYYILGGCYHLKLWRVNAIAFVFVNIHNNKMYKGYNNNNALNEA